MPAKLPRVREDDVVSADLFNALIDAANSCGVDVGQASGLVATAGPDGTVLGTAIPTFFWAKTTGALSGGKYPWTRQLPATGGTWTAGTLTGHAYEVNGNATLATGTYVKVWKSPAGADWLMTASAC